MIFDREAYLKIRLVKKDLATYQDQDVTISGLKISFTVNKTLGWAVNSATIRVWNLSDRHRGMLSDFRDEISLYAGYKSEGGAQLIFIGTTTAVYHEFSQPDIVTVFECADGEKLVIDRPVAVAFGEKILIRQVIEYILAQIGAEIAEFAASEEKYYQNGFTYIGLAREGIKQCCEDLGMEFSVQNGKIRILKKGGISNIPPVEVSARTGLIGIPERYNYRRIERFMTEPMSGWRVRSALRPLILPADRVNLIANRFNLSGEFKIMTLKHQGDTHGELWESTFEVTG